MAGAPSIQVEGMRETRKALRDFSDDTAWRSPLKEAYSGVSSLVEGESRSLASQRRPTLAGTSAWMGGRAVGSIKGKGTTTGASLQAGKGAPEFFGWNFGSTGGHRQFPAKGDPDHALYRAIDTTRERIADTFADRIGDALASAFPG